MAWVVSIWISKPMRPGASPRAFSNSSHSRTIAVTCSAYVTLGRVSTRPSGNPCGRHQPGEEDVEGADAAVAYGGLHALHADARTGRRAALRAGGREERGGAGGRGVLLDVGARAVAVLEVDAQILHGLALQLGPHPGVDGFGEVAGEAEDGGEGVGVGGVLVEGRQRLVAPVAHGGGGKEVGGHVDGVDGLAGAGVAGVAAGELGVDGGEGVGDGRPYATGQAGRHGPLRLHVRSSALPAAASLFPRYGNDDP